MTATLKRTRRHSERSISPPQSRRKVHKCEDASSSDGQTIQSGLRIFSWNVNGVGPLLQKRLSFDTKSECPLRTFLRRHDWPTLLCLQEVKISSKDDVTQRQLEIAANPGKSVEEPAYVTSFSLPRDRYNATGFGGKVHGVATLIRKDFVDQIGTTRRPDWDLEGRVLIHELVDDLVIINGYWVNGTSNPYRSPDSGKVEGTRHDHKLRFHQHMLEEVQGLVQHQKEVILVGDMNIARDRIDGHPRLRTSPVQHVYNRRDFNNKFLTDERGMKAIDVFRHLHGDTRKYTYHPRGIVWGESCDRVDLIIATAPLMESGSVVATDICDSALERGHSDHVPLWVELDLTKTHKTLTSQSMREDD